MTSRFSFAVLTVSLFLAVSGYLSAQVTRPTALADDPCYGSMKTTSDFSVTARAVVVPASANRRNFICSIVIVGAAAEIANVVEGTGTTCQTGSDAMAGSTTAANGMSFAANGGVSAIGGGSTILAGNARNVDVCIVPSSTNRLSGFVTWVQR